METKKRERVDQAYRMLKNGCLPEFTAYELGFDTVTAMIDEMVQFGDNSPTGRTEAVQDDEYIGTIEEEDAPPPERLIANKGRSLVEYDAKNNVIYVMPHRIRLSPREAYDLMDCLRRVLRGQKVIYEREKRRRQEG